jgi:DNA-directed RNA polymerase subunit L
MWVYGLLKGNKASETFLNVVQEKSSKMEIVTIENEKNRLKFQIKGEGHTFCNVLKKELWNDKSVEITGYNIEHGMTTDPVFTLEVSKGDPKKVLLEAVSRLKKINKEIKDKSKTL